MSRSCRALAVTHSLAPVTMLAAPNPGPPTRTNTGLGTGFGPSAGRNDIKRDTPASLSRAIFEHDVLTAEHGVAGVRHGARHEPNCCVSLCFIRLWRGGRTRYTRERENNVEQDTMDHIGTSRCWLSIAIILRQRPILRNVLFLLQCDLPGSEFGGKARPRWRRRRPGRGGFGIPVA